MPLSPRHIFCFSTLFPTSSFVTFEIYPTNISQKESTDKPCDTGSSVSALSSAFPQFDFTGLDPIFPKKSGLYEYSDAGLARRVRAAKELLRDRPEATIVVVSHAGFLRRVTDRRFGNADFRVFSFDGDEPKEEDGGSSTELPAISRGPLIPVAVSNQALGALVLDSPPAPILAAGVSLEGVVEDTTGAGTLHIGKARIGIKSVVRPVTNADPTLVLHEWAMTELKGGGMGRSPKGLASLDDHSHAIRKTGFLGVEAPPPRPKSR